MPSHLGYQLEIVRPEQDVLITYGYDLAESSTDRYDTQPHAVGIDHVIHVVSIALQLFPKSGPSLHPHAIGRVDKDGRDRLIQPLLEVPKSDCDAILGSP